MSITVSVVVDVIVDVLCAEEVVVDSEDELISELIGTIRTHQHFHG